MRLNSGVHRNIEEFFKHERTDQRTGTCGVDVRNFFLPEQSAQHQSKTRLPQKDCAWRSGALLCSFFFQFLREHGVCPPFRLYYHRIRQKFERRRYLFHCSTEPSPGIQFAYERDDWHLASLHFLKLAFEKRQIFIGPAIDQIRSLTRCCSRFALRSASLMRFDRGGR